MENIIGLIKEKLSVPKNLAIAAGVAGILLGLLIGWVLLPVQWTDTNAETMRADLRQDYLRMAITNYNLTFDEAKARQLYQELGNNAGVTLTEVQSNPQFLNADQINRFITAVQAEPANIQTPDENPEQAPTLPGTDKANSPLKLGLILLGLLVIGAIGVYIFYLRPRIKPAGAALPQARPAAVPQAVPRSSNATAQTQGVSTNGRSNTTPTTVQSAAPVYDTPVYTRPNGKNTQTLEKPVAQFMSTYMFGDDLYDESFTFDAPNGEFLGECGVSVSDIIGVGEPKKVTAFEVWLFDKNDIQTVTKVMMSEHVFNDPVLRQRLEMKGEPILAEAGKLFDLRTASLRMEARIVELTYGDLPLPPQSYFQRATIELAVYRI
ncbi:MAG: hypothetical protein GYA81_08875 [Chloroflexi bacterium]|jgi:hypothetical protein|nr:hypothetical protein [Chloroflexota bacterium]